MIDDMKTFDGSRRDFMPYGITCERWRPKVMPRFDRHNEIELNFFPGSSVTYLMSGRVIRVPSRRLIAFWGLIPHQIIQFDGNDEYYVCTIPLSLFLDWHLPEDVQQALLGGRMLAADSNTYSAFDEMLLRQWQFDLRTIPADQTGKLTPDFISITQTVLLEMRVRMTRMSRHFLLIQHEEDGKNCHSGRRKNVYSNEVDMVSELAIFIAKNYMNPIKAVDIGRQVGVHPDYANVLFRKAFGCTLHSYLVQERFSHVERLLITTDRPITDIAFSCGFNTISSFNATFLQIHGCTPREYRARMAT